jgi:hypothetical protein
MGTGAAGFRGLVSAFHGLSQECSAKPSIIAKIQLKIQPYQVFSGFLWGFA